MLRVLEVDKDEAHVSSQLIRREISSEALDFYAASSVCFDAPEVFLSAAIIHLNHFASRQVHISTAALGPT